MNASICLVLLLAVSARCQMPLTAEEEEARRMAENAHYSFMSDVDDRISDLMLHRDETRAGLKLQGSYSYSDGFFRRTTTYTADQFGFHITGQTVEPLSGPMVDPSGTASVHTQLHDGAQIHYRIQSIPDSPLQ